MYQDYITLRRFFGSVGVGLLAGCTFGTFLCAGADVPVSGWVLWVLAASQLAAAIAFLFALDGLE